MSLPPLVTPSVVFQFSSCLRTCARRSDDCPILKRTRGDSNAIPTARARLLEGRGATRVVIHRDLFLGLLSLPLGVEPRVLLALLRVPSCLLLETELLLAHRNRRGAREKCS